MASKVPQRLPTKERLDKPQLTLLGHLDFQAPAPYEPVRNKKLTWIFYFKLFDELRQ